MTPLKILLRSEEAMMDSLKLFKTCFIKVDGGHVTPQKILLRSEEAIIFSLKVIK